MIMTKIIVVCGPTASGKSKLAVDIAKYVGGEVINADSMQVYKGMDIAVAMPSEEEKMGVPHHLFGFVEPTQDFSVAQWLELAREKIAELSERGVTPVIVGGTGLYISSLVDNIIFDDIGENKEFREEMYRLAEVHGNGFLLEKLREVDPAAASRLHENNVKRVVRALETFEVSGKLSTERLEQSRSVCSSFATRMFAVRFENRNILYERIEQRIGKMIEAGLVDEAKKIVLNSTSSQALGHKELQPFFRGYETLETCMNTLKQKTRNYAKRQLTWFRKDERIQWLDFTDYPLILENAIKIIKNFKKM